MSEKFENRNLDTLTEQESTLFKDDLAVMISTDRLVDLSDEDARNLRYEARDHLAIGLNNTSINKEVANIMIQYVMGKDVNNDHALYAYWSVINKANESDEFSVPNRIIGFVAEMAKESGEDSMVADIMQLRRPFDEVIDIDYDDEDEEDEELTLGGQEEISGAVVVKDGSTADVAKGFKDELDLLSDEEQSNLGALINETFDDLNDSLSPAHAKDNKILEDHSFEAEDLLKDIATGRFNTNEGRKAAEAAHDMERLNDIGKDEEELFKNIQLGRFLTPQGQNAAIIRQDFERLKSNSYDADELLKNLVMQRFISEEGIRAAEARQDSERLAKNGQNAVELHKDILLGKFLTDVGRAEAKRQLGLLG